MQLPQGNSCTGCGACVDACSKNALQLKQDSCGFQHPAVNSFLCSDCKRCEQVCPLIKSPEKSKVQKVFAVRAIDEIIESKSSSGGAFSVLAEYVLGLNGVVYGAGFNENYEVCHKRIDRPENLKDIRGSKYVQSDFLAGAKEASADLKNGRTVLFCGTPCQIAALKNMSRTLNNPKLFTVDFICHGVASPLLFEKYVCFVNKGKKITDIIFRDKTEGWHKYSMKITFDDGTAYRKRAIYDPYMTAYAQNISIRSSCNNCKFTGVDRVSDITMGDAWTQELNNANLKDGKGVSLLLVNTEKGRRLFDAVNNSLICEELSNDVLHTIRPLNTPTKVNPLKNRYYYDMHKLRFDRLTKKYCGSSVIAKTRRLVYKKIFRWRQSFE